MSGTVNPLMMPNVAPSPAQPPGADPLQAFWSWLASARGGQQPTMPAQGAPSTDAPWVQNLKRLVQPNVDHGAWRQPQYQNTDPGLNRLGPQVGDILRT